MRRTIAIKATRLDAERELVRCGQYLHCGDRTIHKFELARRRDRSMRIAFSSLQAISAYVVALRINKSAEYLAEVIETLDVPIDEFQTASQKAAGMSSRLAEDAFPP